jgi:hypothetical protein
MPKYTGFNIILSYLPLFLGFFGLNLISKNSPMKSILLLFLSVSLVLLPACSGSAESSGSSGTDKSETATSGYQCPMKCEGDSIHAHDGNCSVCGMKLEKVNEK